MCGSLKDVTYGCTIQSRWYEYPLAFFLDFRPEGVEGRRVIFIPTGLQTIPLSELCQLKQNTTFGGELPRSPLLPRRGMTPQA